MKRWAIVRSAGGDTVPMLVARAWSEKGAWRRVHRSYSRARRHNAEQGTWLEVRRRAEATTPMDVLLDRELAKMLAGR